MLFLSACFTSTDVTAPDAATSAPTKTFGALVGDFQPYASWTNFYVGDVPDPNGVDLAGPRTVYINAMPPPGSTQFPVGTMIVKVIETSEAPQTWQMFALVKRGGDFDSQGAPGWEWFGLAMNASNEVVIEWRGDGPPPDGGYGGINNVGCIYCHTQAKANDYVQTPQLQLAQLK
jgi:hypothetical protein